jgi:hypothetical protein
MTEFTHVTVYTDNVHICVYESYIYCTLTDNTHSFCHPKAHFDLCCMVLPILYTLCNICVNAQSVSYNT